MANEAPSFYRQLITRSWRLVKKNPWTWFLGLFSAILVGAAGEYNLLAKSISNVSSSSSIFYGLTNTVYTRSGLLEIWQRFLNLEAWGGTGFWLAAVIFVVIALYVIWLIVVSEPALVFAANKLDTQQPVTFGQAFAAGRSHGSASLILNLIGKVLVWVVLFGIEFLLAYLFVSSGNSAWIVLYLVATFIVLLPIAIIISFVTKFALTYVVTQGMNPWRALLAGWRLFFRHWLASLEVALIVFVVYFIVGLLLIFSLLVLLIPLFALMVVGVGLSQPLFWFALALGFGVFFAGLLIVGSILSAWQLSTWVLLFDHLIKEEVQPTIIRWASGQPSGVVK